MEKIYALLEEIRPDIDFRKEENLATDGYIDSFDIVSIISALEQEFDVDIPVDSIVPENFESAKAIMSLVRALNGEV